MKILVLLLFSGLSLPMFAQQVEVTIKGIEIFTGSVLVAVYDSEESFMKKHRVAKKVKATGSQVTVAVEELKAGSYAVSTFHDVNDNEKLDTNFIGIPKELYGFSNDAKGSFGPPSFEKAKIEIDGDKKLVINLR